MGRASARSPRYFPLFVKWSSGALSRRPLAFRPGLNGHFTARFLLNPEREAQCRRDLFFCQSADSALSDANPLSKRALSDAVLIEVFLKIAHGCMMRESDLNFKINNVP